VCIGCTQPGFTDAFEPFYAKLPYAPVGVDTLTKVAVASAAAIAGAGVIGGVWASARARAEKKGGEKAEEKK
jgi:hydrogenase small subunit